MMMRKLSSNYRYERKFFIPELTIDEVESIVKMNPAMFQEIFYQRFVNNIYFDSVGLESYYDNVVGAYDRTKIRVRWYGELIGYIENPVLEIKIKRGVVCRKKSYCLQPFQLENSNIFRMIDSINKSEIPAIVGLGLKNLEPILLNRYRRKYFMSADGDYRITVDTDLSFSRINCQNNIHLDKTMLNNNVILELKYDQCLDDYAHLITHHFPFRLTKSSKYLIGIERLFS